MKQVVQDIRSCRVDLEEVPPPRCMPGGVLVRTAASLISAGTERAIIRLGSRNLLAKALERPDLVARLYRHLRTAGAVDALAAVRARLQTAIALGYSASGVVIEAGEQAEEFVPGDCVACAGAGYSSHAEINWVPKNLCAKIPSGVEFEQAATAAVGAIALQAVRIADAKLGERVAVIGLGLIGQLVAQILHAAGCVVWACDIDSERVKLARELGTDFACEYSARQGGPANEWLGDSRGADAVIIAANTRSAAPIELAGRLARDRGAVVVVGDVRVEIPREHYYGKELQVRYSRSLGPGRYDPVYEELGVDYPYGFVRWTEKRNLEAYLELLAAGKVRVEPLITHRFPIRDACQAYTLLADPRKEKPLGIMFTYPVTSETSSRIVIRSQQPRHQKRLNGAGTVRIGWIGAGKFSRAKLLPALRTIKGIEWVGVSNRTGISAKRVAREFGFSYATTDVNEILNDPGIDAVFIAPRHDLHAPVTRAGLERGKHVFVEKPLCVTEAELDSLAEVYAKSSAILSVGFNRRFSPFASECARFFEERREPLNIIYRISAGPLPLNHWIFEPEQGGGPVVGEMCHFVDLVMFLTSSLPRRVQAWPLSRGDTQVHAGVHAEIELTDESRASLYYILAGDRSVPKERIEVFSEGRTAISDDFRRSDFYQFGRRKSERSLWQKKGHRNELRAFIDGIRNGGESPIRFEHLYAATLASFRIRDALASGKPVPVIGRQQ
jgi:predicted dehydrogenase